MDWLDPPAGNPYEERDEDMSSLIARFVARMRKRAASAQGETVPCFEVYGGKRPKWFGLDEEAQKSLTVITMDSLEQASNALPSLDCASQDESGEACASLQNGSQSGGLSMLMELLGRLNQR